jgi:hypothetical protein
MLQDEDEAQCKHALALEVQATHLATLEDEARSVRTLLEVTREELQSEKDEFEVRNK